MAVFWHFLIFVFQIKEKQKQIKEAKAAVKEAKSDVKNLRTEKAKS